MPPPPYPTKSHLVDDYFPLEHDDFRGLCLIQQEEMLGVTHPSTSCMNKIHSTSLNYNNRLFSGRYHQTGLLQ